MAITVSQATIWSARIDANLKKALVYVPALCNRNYEGDIAGKGDTVRIISIGALTIGTYTGSVGTPEALTDANVELVIDQAKFFNFAVDDVDEAASVVPLIEGGAQEAGYGLGEAADAYVPSLHAGITTSVYGNSTTPITVGLGSGDDDTPYGALLKLSELMSDQSVPNVDRRVVIPNWMATGLKKELGLNRSTAAGDQIVTNGFITKIDNMSVFASVNVPNTTATKYKVIAGVTDGFAFASKILKTETYRVESAFSTGVKGLFVYGAKIFNEKKLALGTFNKGTI